MGLKGLIWNPKEANSGLRWAKLRLKEDHLELKGANSGVKLAKFGGLDRPNPVKLRGSVVPI